MGKDRNYVPVWVWLVAIVVMWIPLINVAVAFVGAFLGENESRKNFFRAQLLLIMAGMILVLLGLLGGLGPALLEWLQQQIPALRPDGG